MVQNLESSLEECGRSFRHWQYMGQDLKRTWCYLKTRKQRGVLLYKCAEVTSAYVRVPKVAHLSSSLMRSVNNM